MTKGSALEGIKPTAVEANPPEAPQVAEVAHSDEEADPAHRGAVTALFYRRGPPNLMHRMCLVLH